MGYVAVIAAVAAGFLLGLLFRAPALIAMTVLVVAACATAGATHDWPFTDIAIWALLLTATMQASYIAGVAFAHFVRSRRN